MQTKIVPVSQLNDLQIRQMFGVMDEYYSKISFENFVEDLREKKKTILLLKSDQSICGFSTILDHALEVDGRRFLRSSVAIQF